MKVNIMQVDYSHSKQAEDLIYLLNCYANDPMGGATPLSEKVKRNLVKTLSELPHAFSVICYVDEKPAGLINCFESFSTFQCKPLVNIHDIIVTDKFRRHGLCQKMLSRVEMIAKGKGCCKITLEVLEGNKTAQKSYQNYGFSSYELDPEMGSALFWQKVI